MSLTEQEKSVIDSLVEAWNRFSELPVLHEWDAREFMHGIHQCQKIVMARPVQKEWKNPSGLKACEFCAKPLTVPEEIQKGYHTDCLPF